ncbi:hypothetical protein F2P56_021649 [Juglans regia]|uniref:Protein REVEILLE 1-like n=2 Tax=Juglans regia TaxID=51240 RepID=A0A833X2N7_JUGRE|nr:protein REVEILLE 1-like isoform X1 [Juglans regia]KAF5457554.1 hypothetical protein F2P56_021649 [Juglans regia]
MAIQDQSVGILSHSLLRASNGMPLSSGLHSVTGTKLRDQFSCGNSCAPKVRKQYTITKQRERWSEEEHKKFLDALKLYGRSWPRIEEHVGTKTAVQIRSHAQKFFSKVVRDSNGGNISSEPIEIPPPRPKRKPKHPYPRKLGIRPKKETSTLKQPIRSASPNISVSEEENQSPTSVLSAIGSYVAGSDTPNDSFSPLSSAASVQSGGLVLLPEPNQSTERSASPSPALMTLSSVSDAQLPTKRELLPKGNACANEGTLEELSPQYLKIFGRTVLVTNSGSSSHGMGTGNSIPADMQDKKFVQALPVNSLPVESLTGNTECVWSQFPHVTHGAPSFMQCQKESSNRVEDSTAAHMPWWTFYGGLPFPFLPFHKEGPSKAYVDSDLGEVQDKVQKEGSCTGSNTGSVNDEENGDKCSEAETQSRPIFLGNENQGGGLVFQLRPSEKSAFSKPRKSPEKCVKGFVPYKRCTTERDIQSSKITGQEGDEKRIRLCL